MNTTIFLPMPEWQALSFLRDHDKAFSRLLTPAGIHHDCEVVLVDDALFGFKNRADALETGQRVYPHGFAMVRFVVLGKVLNSKMSLKGYLQATTDTASGIALYKVNREGLTEMSERVPNGEVEILIDRIFGSCNPEHQHEREFSANDAPDHGLLEDGGRPAFRGPRDQFGCGPTGFGC